MTTGNHDTLVYRLAQILVKLNQGVKLDPLALAKSAELLLLFRTLRGQDVPDEKLPDLAELIRRS